jgi:hypothetical protein
MLAVLLGVFGRITNMDGLIGAPGRRAFSRREPPPGSMDFMALLLDLQSPISLPQLPHLLPHDHNSAASVTQVSLHIFSDLPS